MRKDRGKSVTSRHKLESSYTLWAALCENFESTNPMTKQQVRRKMGNLQCPNIYAVNKHLDTLINLREEFESRGGNMEDDEFNIQLKKRTKHREITPAEETGDHPEEAEAEDTQIQLLIISGRRQMWQKSKQQKRTSHRGMIMRQWPKRQNHHFHTPF